MARPRKPDKQRRPPGRPRKPKPNGHPTHEPTEHIRNTVRLHVVNGTLHADIARVFGIDEKTLRKHYRRELNVAKSEVDVLATQTIVQRMLGAVRRDPKNPDKPAYDHNLADALLLKFYAERRMGWVMPKQEIQHSGSVGTFDMSKLSDEEVERVTEILERAAGRRTNSLAEREGEA